MREVRKELEEEKIDDKDIEAEIEVMTLKMKKGAQSQGI
jgi:hypothetical protein